MRETDRYLDLLTEFEQESGMGGVERKTWAVIRDQVTGPFSTSRCLMNETLGEPGLLTFCNDFT